MKIIKKKKVIKYIYIFNVINIYYSIHFEYTFKNLVM